MTDQGIPSSQAYEHEGIYMVCEPRSHLEQTALTSDVYIADAREMARFLEDREAASRVGERLSRVRRAVASKTGIAYSILYALRYRPPKQIAVEIYDKLCLAVEAAAAKQIEALEHDIATARARHQRRGRSDLRAAQTVARQARQELARLRSGHGSGAR